MHLKEGWDFWLNTEKMVLIISIVENGKVFEHHKMPICLVRWGLSVLGGGWLASQLPARSEAH